MAITKEKLLELLNRDLALEYMAIVQYAQHTGVVTGAAYMTIRKELMVHASEELQHAMTLADQIDFLGGEPTVEVPTAHTSADTVTMLQQDLDGEIDAVNRYKVRVRQAEELDLYDLGQKLREILAMEQEHMKDLQEALG
jgi:bacterioferritin